MQTRFWPLLAAILIAPTLVIACTSDDGGGATPTVSDPGVASPAASETLGLDAALRAEAKSFCPEASLDACSDSYVQAATSSLPAALCVNGDTGTWFMETPGGVPGEPVSRVEVGDPCAGDPAHQVVALVNYFPQVEPVE